MTKGILLCSWNKVGYGYAAFNFAASLKFVSPDIPITLYCDEQSVSHLGDNHKAIFDSIIVMGEPVSDPGLFKVSIYDKLPYDYTLFMDVDALCMGDITEFLDRLIDEYKADPDGKFYRTHVHGWYDKDSDVDLPLMYWARRDVIWDTYQFTDHKLPATQSSIQFIAKCDKAYEFYKDLRHLMEFEYIPLEALKHKWGGTQPDELYLNIQIAKSRLTPDIGDVMWFCDNSKHRPFQLKAMGYLFLSYFGVRAQIKTYFVDYYDDYLIKILRKMGFANHLWKSQHIFHEKHAGNRVQQTAKAQTNQLSIAKQIQAKREVFISESEKTIHLFTSYYQARTKSRQAELDECLLKNLDNPYINKVFVATECEMPFDHEKLVAVKCERPTMNALVEFANLNSGDINVMCNGDIYTDSTVSMVKDFNLEKTVLCLSRWDRHNDGRLTHFDYEYSQDTWIWEGKLQFTGGNYYFGLLGCDNKFAHDVFTSGYKVLNPSRHIVTIHVHNTGERTGSEKTRLPRPYRNVSVCDLKELLTKKLLIIQPGKVGDILICLPIAEHYAKMGYTVEWECPKKYHDLFSYVDYVKPVESRSGEYKLELDMSFGLNTKSKVHALWLRKAKTIDSFIRLKYELANVPIEKFRSLNYNRNTQKEKKLYELLIPQGTAYKLAHRSSDYGAIADVPVDCILFEQVSGYTIFDWRMIIENAEEIHCIDSSLVNFVDAIGSKAKLFYYINDRVPNQSDRVLLTKDWEVVNQLDYANSI